MEPADSLSEIISSLRARGITLKLMSDNDIEVSPASAITPADFTFLEKNCDAITELMLHENHSVEVAAESPDEATGLEIREGEKGEIRPLEEQGAASDRVARNEAEIDRLATVDEAGREHEAAASCRISDGVHRPRQWPAESGQQAAIGMQVTGIHRVAAAFPPMEGHAYEELIESIRVHGLRQPIILTCDGLVIDGVNRLRACRDAGLEPVFETLPDFYDEEAIIRYIVDANLNRRDLSVGQRAMLAAEVIEPALRDAAKKRQRGGQGGRLLLANSPKANYAAPVHAREQAAKRSQVSDNSVAKAERILKHAPDLRAKIMANQISLHKADQQLRQRLEPDGASVPPPPFSLTLTNGGGSVTYRALSKDFSAPELNSFDWIVIGAKRSSPAIEQAVVLGGQAQAVGCAVFHTSTALEEAIAKGYPAMAMLREVPGKKTRP